MRRPRFDPVHADAAPRQRLQHAVQRAGPVADEHQQRGAVVAGRRERFATEHQEARGVVAAVLDRAGDALQAVHQARGLAGDRRCVVGVACTARAFRIARDRQLLRPRQVRAQPAGGLREGLRVGIDALDVLDPAAARQQVLVHAQFDFAADLQRRGEEQVEGDLDRALPGVLDRDHAEVGVAGRDFLEHLLDAGHRQAMRRMPEVLVHGLLAEGALGPQVADLQRFLLGEAGRHHLAEHAHQHLVGERAVVAVHHPAQDLRLAFRAVVIDRRGELALGLADLVRPARALGDQRLDLLVDAVDLRADFTQVGLGGGLGLGRWLDGPGGLRSRGLPSHGVPGNRA